mmetsp:Transcript_23743/g.48250  ORF Transcript_23743/g.48250 Transcript_23743/m.48250 type:complete len:231 (+) Transcript_23743:550-1242(+)
MCRRAGRRKPRPVDRPLGGDEGLKADLTQPRLLLLYGEVEVVAEVSVELVLHEDGGLHELLGAAIVGGVAQLAQLLQLLPLQVAQLARHLVVHTAHVLRETQQRRLLRHSAHLTERAARGIGIPAHHQERQMRRDHRVQALDGKLLRQLRSACARRAWARGQRAYQPLHLGQHRIDRFYLLLCQRCRVALAATRSPDVLLYLGQQCLVHLGDKLRALCVGDAAHDDCADR